METIKFVHKVSKGSRFNQIYIPLEMERAFSVGDLVEVKLLEKKSLHNSKGIKLNEFKEGLVKSIFSFLLGFRNIKRAFVVGSFLTRNDYNDIDVVIVAEKDSDFENKLTEKFDMKFHVVCIPEERFLRLLAICPLTRSMLYNYVSNKGENLIKDREIDLNHLNFLLMMPQDLLEIKISGRAYYDSVRRLIAIEKFLGGREENPDKINREAEKLLGGDLFSRLRNNDYIVGIELERVRNVIKNKLNAVRRGMKDG